MGEVLKRGFKRSWRNRYIQRFINIASICNVPVRMEIMKGRYVILLLCVYALECYGLTCRSEGSQKDDDLKKIYETCLKRQGGNRSENHWHSSERGWKDNDRERPRNKDNKNNNRENQAENRNNGMTENKYNGMRYKEQNNDGRSERDRMEGRESRNNMYDRIDDRYNSMGRSNERNSNSDQFDRNERNRNMMRRNEQVSGRDEFLQSEETGSEMPKQTYYNSQPNKRNKRDKHVEKNSGQRSQYNPNSHGTGHDNANENKNLSSNANQDQDKACALHCFLENMQMTGENGMPDRYLVTHAITKNIKNEDLRDFLQESIEECFQILDNENTEDKCEFSKNLLLCLSEKGRANCDDWKDNYQF